MAIGLGGVSLVVGFSDSFPVKLLQGVAVFAAASAGCGVAPDNATLLVGRVIQGAGAALMIPATLALIVTNFPPDLVPRAIGLWAG